MISNPNDRCCICGHAATTSIHDPVEDRSVPFCGCCEATQSPGALANAVERYDPDALPRGFQPQKLKRETPLGEDCHLLPDCARCQRPHVWAVVPGEPGKVAPRCPGCGGPEEPRDE